MKSIELLNLSPKCIAFNFFQYFCNIFLECILFQGLELLLFLPVLCPFTKLYSSRVQLLPTLNVANFYAHILIILKLKNHLKGLHLSEPNEPWVPPVSCNGVSLNIFKIHVCTLHVQTLIKIYRELRFSKPNVNRLFHNF